jgi:hypothetical protein
MPERSEVKGYPMSDEILSKVPPTRRAFMKTLLAAFTTPMLLSF